MGEGCSREKWVAGLILASGGFFLTLAGSSGAAVFWGLSWSFFNAFLPAAANWKRVKGQLLLPGINFILAAGWLFASGRGNGSPFPFLLLLPLLIPFYRAEKRVLLLGLAASLFLITGWYIKQGLVFAAASPAMLGAAIALAGFCYLIGSRMVTAAARIKALELELEHWQREYQVSRSRLADVEAIAVTDDLTRVFNYRYFDRHLERMLAPGLQYRSLAVLMVDIDHFKEINDTYGHLTGNRVLAELAALLKEYTREGDVVTRFGGEEFAIILPGSDYDGALQVAERIRRAIAEHTFNQGGVPISLTVSTGLVVWPEDGASKEELITHADQALYQAKITGRNSVCPYRLLKPEQLRADANTVGAASAEG